jgi:endonuclease/exonuclease/phosphatase family metal-dependent hydrolase
MRRFFPLALLSLGIALGGCSSANESVDDGSDAVGAESGPPILSYDELVTLSDLPGHRAGPRYVIDGAPAGLEDKVNTLLDTPRISNKWYGKGVRRHMPDVEGLGPSVRVVEWNIERGEQLDNILAVFKAANDPDAKADFLANGVNDDVKNDADRLAAVSSQLDSLGNADVIVLNEVDNGMKRSGYADVVAQVADTLQMNFAYAVEFIEVDPVVLGTAQFDATDFQAHDSASGQPLAEGADGYVSTDELQASADEVNAMVKDVDASRMKGLHGVAILSRYKIVKDSVKVHPLQTVCHDWNSDEKKALDIAGKGFNWIADKVFLEKISREIRHAGRTALTVDLEVPGLDGNGKPNTLTVVTAHIEDKTTPKCRADSAKETLQQVKDRQNPVVFAGDFNTFGTDGRPMTVERLLFARFKDPAWITRQLTGRLIPYAGWAWMIDSAINWIRKLHDPTGVNIPLFLPNPERGFFDNVENFVFPDGTRFDFRGDKDRTVNATKKTLANSNQRAAKGFAPSNALQRTYGPVGTFKIDWIFVRGYAKDSRSDHESYRMAPHFPVTMMDLQFSTAPRLSDHAPMKVDLPLKDPCVGQSSAACTGSDAIPDQDPDYADGETWADVNTYASQRSDPLSDATE